MGDRTVKAIIQDAALGNWSIPEFQRRFEWKPEQVAKLCHSLCDDLPIGLITVWNTTKYNEPQVRPVTGRIPLWVVDGQQRISALCIMAATKPYWMNNTEWDEVFTKNRMSLNINQDGSASIGRVSKKATVVIPLDELIHRKPGEAQRYVQGKCTEASILQSAIASDVAVGALKVLESSVPVAEVGEDKDVEEIAELYRRLNQQGTRLREAQIMLAFVSQYNPGWVRQEFYPFLESLSNKDEWELDPAHVLQVATIHAEGKARVGKATIPDMWKEKVKQVWPSLRSAIDISILHLWDKGITDQDMIPSSYTLIALFAIQTKFMDKPGCDFDRLFKWFVLANLSGRYGDAPLETLTGDGADIYKASNFEEALKKLAIGWAKDDLHKLVNDAFKDNSSQALLLHVILWSTEARDLLENLSIPALTQATQGQSLEPHWHHIVPKAWGKANNFKDCDKTANVTRLCKKTNIRSSLKSKPPWQYIPELGIQKDTLIQHLVPDKYADKFIKGQPLSPSEFNEFLKEREELIVQHGAKLLGI